MGVPVEDFLIRRRNRVVGAVLGHAEREFFSKLTAQEQDTFRTLVRDAVSNYHEAVVDLVRSEDGTRNDEVVTLLERVERQLRARVDVPAQTGV